MSSDTGDSMSTFRFLDLPDELRLKLYRFILPRRERLHLDPDNVQFPIPYIVDDSYGTTFNLLLTCKKIHHEATQFIYENNTVNIIDTSEKGNFLQGLGLTACRYISKLECHVVEGFVDLGNIWDTMKQCPRLLDVRLVFYHERENWSKTLAQIVQCIQPKDQASADGVIPINLDLELHSSIWAYRYAHFDYQLQFHQHLDRAKRSAKVYRLELPSQLRHITITASVSQTVLQDKTFASWSDGDSVWCFRPHGSANSHPNVHIRKTLRFAKGEAADLSK